VSGAPRCVRDRDVPLLDVDVGRSVLAVFQSGKVAVGVDVAVAACVDRANHVVVLQVVVSDGW
jgi:hypothetical protein